MFTVLKSPDSVDSNHHSLWPSFFFMLPALGKETARFANQSLSYQEVSLLIRCWSHKLLFFTKVIRVTHTSSYGHTYPWHPVTNNQTKQNKTKKLKSNGGLALLFSRPEILEEQTEENLFLKIRVRNSRQAIYKYYVKQDKKSKVSIRYFPNCLLIPGNVAPWVTCWPCKHEDLDLLLRSHCKSRT